MPPPTDKVTVADPIPHLNHLLYQAMKTGDERLPISSEVVLGFGNIERGFYSAFRQAFNKGKLLSYNVEFPEYLVVERGDGSLRWTRPPESDKEQLYHFLFHLRSTISELVANPIGKKSTVSSTEVAHMLTQLPRRAAFVRSGEDVGVIYTDNTPPALDADALRKRLSLIREQTRAKYCQAVSQADSAPPEEPDEGPPLSRWEEVE